MKKFQRLLLAVFLLPIFGGLADIGGDGGAGDAGKGTAGAGDGATGNNTGETGNGTGETGGSDKPLSAEEIQALIKAETQKEGDRVRTEYAKKLKDAEDKVKKIERDKLSDEDKHKAELTDKELALQEKEAAINAKEMALIATDTLTAEGLDASLREFVMGSSKEEVETKTKKLKVTIGKLVEATVAERFKTAGYIPGGGSENGGAAVDESKMTDAQWLEYQKKKQNKK
jgi:hypothetical protein